MDKGKNVVLSQRDHIDRSKIRILLCDINAESCQEILALLCQCSYQVVAVWSAREVFDKLNSEGPRAHIILAEVNLLMANDAGVLRYIMHEKKLQKIPVIILTTRDQVSITVKGLRLGAADYLVKPLHEDELSNLWMHFLK
ncbi:UNVERIFIED_CONTAM: Two-component response regulator-like APRR1 [Sesamum latifolium]|uniref:Two-component response regulator-like APRR1 n=1 Tax=Sesamum latifolium TaxID=2727402 RepID=A0AAW2UY97_9LAMI